jgi:3D (Asp-Asp-Asp) domain-containing protein
VKIRRCAIALSSACAATFTAACAKTTGPVRVPGVVVMSTFRATGAIVRGATRGWWKSTSGPARFGEPFPVGVTMYCLRGTTRRGRYVRSGIVAADPKFFPLARYLELYVGQSYLGRFIVDDTGDRIKGPRIDVWTSDCAEARSFGMQRGTAMRVARDPGRVQQAGSPKGRNR